MPNQGLFISISVVNLSPPTSVGVRPLGGHGGAVAVVPHPLRAPLQLLQPNPQLSLLPAKAILQPLRSLVLLLQLLEPRKTGNE